ncbi:MAG: response regulator [Deltaproteobacteria bacterium]|nr:response regulator [Deltaproteobacteria bacterium]
MNLLLVDDEKKFASMLARRLELRGMQVTVCFSGEDALAAVEKEASYDVAILDVKMPGIGGMELKNRLREQYPRMKIIFLTGHGANADFQAGVQEAEAYLPKPLNINDLIASLKRLEEET